MRKFIVFLTMMTLLLALAADGDYTVKVYAQLGTGERPTLWEGKLAQ